MKRFNCLKKCFVLSQAMLMLTQSINVYANNVTYDDLVVNQAVFESRVTFEKPAVVNISIPEKCCLNSRTKSGTYSICIEGEVQPNVAYNVEPRDDNESMEGINFRLVNESTALSKKDDIWGTIVQDDNTWSATEINTKGVCKYGTITVDSATAGHWNGSITFDIISEEVYKSFQLVEGKNITSIIKKSGSGNGIIQIIANEAISEISATALSDAISQLSDDFKTLTITDVYVSWNDGDVANQNVLWGLNNENVNLHFNVTNML